MDLFERGGWMSIPILLASAWGLTLYIERLLFLTPTNVIPRTSKIKFARWYGTVIQEAMVLSESNDTPWAMIVSRS